MEQEIKLTSLHVFLCNLVELTHAIWPAKNMFTEKFSLISNRKAPPGALSRQIITAEHLHTACESIQLNRIIFIFLENQ